MWFLPPPPPRSVVSRLILPPPPEVWFLTCDSSYQKCGSSTVVIPPHTHTKVVTHTEPCNLLIVWYSNYQHSFSISMISVLDCWNYKWINSIKSNVVSSSQSLCSAIVGHTFQVKNWERWDNGKDNKMVTNHLVHQSTYCSLLWKVAFPFSWSYLDPASAILRTGNMNVPQLERKVNPPLGQYNGDWLCAMSLFNLSWTVLMYTIC